MTKYEKRETKSTAATFSSDEVYGFVAGSYAADRRRQYLEKVATRPVPSRLTDDGAERLSSHSMVADVDMTPLSMRQNIGRFMKYTSSLDGDGFDTDESVDNDEHFYDIDRIENPPSPHELRAQKLETRLQKARKEYQDALEARRKGGSTPENKAQGEPSGEEGPTPPKG